MTASNNMLYTDVYKADEDKVAYWDHRTRQLAAEAQQALDEGRTEDAEQLLARAQTCSRALDCVKQGRRPNALSAYRRHGRKSGPGPKFSELLARPHED